MLNPLDGKYITQVFNLVLVALIIYFTKWYLLWGFNPLTARI